MCIRDSVKKEDNTFAELDEVITVKVIEFNRDDKRIIVSHSRYVEDIQREARGEELNQKRKQRDDVRQAVKKTQSKVERSTLGDLSALAALKDQLADAPAAEKEEKVTISKDSSEEEE